MHQNRHFDRSSFFRGRGSSPRLKAGVSAAKKLMTRSIPRLTDEELTREATDDEPGFGSLTTPRGHLPLKAMDVRGRIDGLLSQVSRAPDVRQPARRTARGHLHLSPARSRRGPRLPHGGRRAGHRGRCSRSESKARQDYDQAIAAGHRAAIAEEERPNVFTLRVGNLMPGEEATVHLELAGVLPYSGGEVTFRFPLVVAPRYIPGVPLPGPSVGDGTAVDTDAVPDASRISPPVLLPGFPNPVRLSLDGRPATTTTAASPPMASGRACTRS